MNYLDEAISLACCAHKGQVDKAGSPYILHPLRLMLKFDDENLKIISVLHDVIEDSSVTIDDLRCLGFSDLIVQAIDCLSKRPDEVYEDFISRVSINELARRVKIEDIKDNLDLTRLFSLGENDFSRINKYHKALNILISADRLRFKSSN